MFFKGVPVVFCFKDEITMSKVMSIYEELGPDDFGTYILSLIEKDLYEEVVEEKVKERIQTVAPAQSVDSNDIIISLLEKLDKIIDNGVPIAQIQPLKVEARAPRAGDENAVKEFEEELPTAPIVIPKKPKNNLNGLKNSKNILGKMSEMRK